MYLTSLWAALFSRSSLSPPGKSLPLAASPYRPFISPPPPSPIYANKPPCNLDMSCEMSTQSLPNCPLKYVEKLKLLTAKTQLSTNKVDVYTEERQ